MVPLSRARSPPFQICHASGEVARRRRSYPKRWCILPLHFTRSPRNCTFDFTQIYLYTSYSIRARHQDIGYLEGYFPIVIHTPLPHSIIMYRNNGFPFYLRDITYTEILCVIFNPISGQFLPTKKVTFTWVKFILSWGVMVTISTHCIFFFSQSEKANFTPLEYYP